MSRRAFLKTAASAAVLNSASTAPAAGVRQTPPGHEDLIRLLIDTDRDRLLEQLAIRIRAGLDYPALLGAVAEASARSIRPQPHVGFKYHAFMVLHAVHLTRLLGRPEDRWMPILWAADVFKASQAAERRLGNWTLGPVPEHLVPSGGRAQRGFRRAMDKWDLEAADVATVAMLRTLPRDRVYEVLFRYGARDFRAIGHKTITVANCHRLTGFLGPKQAEPMLRSLVRALLNHKDEPNPGSSDLLPDRPWRRNLALLQQARSAAQPGKPRNHDEVAEMLQILREGTYEDASRGILASLDRGVSDADLWTAIFAAAGDLMLKQPGILAVHANTTSNALHYGYRHVGDAVTGQLLLLQAASFLPLFRDLLGSDGSGPGIDTLAPLEVGRDPDGALQDIFATLSSERVAASRKALGYLDSGGAQLPFLTLARHYVVDRNTGYHDYKLAEAAFENAASMHPPWRERYLATSVLYLNGSADKPNQVVRQARALLV